MSDTQLGTRATGTDRRDVGVRHSEARAGQKTTEFMLTVIAAVATLIAAYASGTGAGSFPVRWGWLIAGFIVAAYAISRGIAKAGRSDYRGASDVLR